MKVIKRYRNRKLYDTDASRYVTLSDINKMIKRGEDVKVVDNDTGEDITSLIITQVIHTEEKKKRFLPQDGLKWLLKHGEDAFAEFISNIHQIRKEAEKQIQRLVRGKRRDDRGKYIVDALVPYFKNIEEFQRKAEKNIESVLEKVGNLFTLPKDFVEMAKRVQKIEKEIEKLKVKVKKLEKGRLH